jgi:exodeoxyribonuclease VII large subunit
MKEESLEIRNHKVKVKYDESLICVYNSFSIKDELKSRGYKWHPKDKSWRIEPKNPSVELDSLRNNLSYSTTKVHNTIVKELSSLPHSYTILDLRHRINQIIADGVEGNVWVRGVIASEIKHYDGISFLELKDDERDVYFNADVSKINLEKMNLKLRDSGTAECLDKDLPVFCFVKIHLSFKSSVHIKLTLLDILPEYTNAKIKNQLEITMETFEKEGVISKQKNLFPPKVISTIGLITSEKGKALEDMRTALNKFANHFDFRFLDTRVEGDLAVTGLVGAIKFLSNQKRKAIDLILITRGGGSEQSLAVFNNLELCRAVCNCPIPIISAIGHEKDNTAIEFCSWLNPIPSTPTGIGIFLRDGRYVLKNELNAIISQIVRRSRKVHLREEEKIQSLIKYIPLSFRKIHYHEDKRIHSLIGLFTPKLKNIIFNSEGSLQASIRLLQNSLIGKYRQHQTSIINLSKKITEEGQKTIDRRIISTGILVKDIQLHVISKELNERQKIKGLIVGINFDEIWQNTSSQKSEVKEKMNLLFKNLHYRLKIAEEDLQKTLQLAISGDPEKILKRGFSLVFNTTNERVITSLKQFIEKKSGILRFQDGTACITSKKWWFKKEENENE